MDVSIKWVRCIDMVSSGLVEQMCIRSSCVVCQPEVKGGTRPYVTSTVNLQCVVFSLQYANQVSTKRTLHLSYVICLVLLHPLARRETKVSLHHLNPTKKILLTPKFRHLENKQNKISKKRNKQKRRQKGDTTLPGHAWNAPKLIS